MLPRAFENTAVRPGVDAIAVLHSVFVVSIVACTVRPCLFALALLDIVHPLALITAAIDMSINSVTISLIGAEFANVDVTFRVPECSLAFSFIIEPVALVDGAIDPLLNAEATTLLDAFLTIN